MLKDLISLRLERLERRLNKMNVRGIVHEIDPNFGSGGAVRIFYGDDQVSDWLPVKPLRSGDAAIWWFPSIGEGVTVTDIDTGEVLPGSFTSDNPPPSRDPDVLYIKFKDESFISHNQSTGNYESSFTGDVKVIAKGKVSVDSEAKDIQLNGGKGVVTGDCICAYTGNPHSDFSQVVKAAK